MSVLDLDAIEEDLKDQPDALIVGLHVEPLIAEVHRLREIVLRDHRPPATLNDFCMECSGEWPCPSARAAGAE